MVRFREYHTLAAVWTTRTAGAEKKIGLSSQQQKVKSGQVSIYSWNPGSDMEIARQVIATMKY